MSNHLKDKIEKILELLDRLAIQSTKGTPIVVEGKKDVDVLRKLAVSGEIITAKNKKSFLALAADLEKLNVEEVILLLDFDKRGKEWTRRLTQYLEQTTVRPNTFFWKGLASLLSRNIKDIEGLLPYLQTLKKKTGHSQTIIESKL